MSRFPTSSTRQARFRFWLYIPSSFHDSKPKLSILLAVSELMMMMIIMRTNQQIRKDLSFSYWNEQMKKNSPNEFNGVREKGLRKQSENQFLYPKTNPLELGSAASGRTKRGNKKITSIMRFLSMPPLTENNWIFPLWLNLFGFDHFFEKWIGLVDLTEWRWKRACTNLRVRLALLLEL